MQEPGALAMMEESLERVSELCEDLTPLVYDRFFERHPDVQPYFMTGQRARGRMLHEVMTWLIEAAEDRDYLPINVEVMVKDHVAFGRIPLSAYRGLLDAFIATMATLLGEAWTPAYEAAWRGAADRLLTLVAGSMQQPELLAT